MNYKSILHKLGLLSVIFFFIQCSEAEFSPDEEDFKANGKGVLILNEGNYNYGNSSLSYYTPNNCKVENNVFFRANQFKMGDTGQSITLFGNTAIIAMEASGTIWGIDTETFKVKAQLTVADTEHMINPRFVHVVNEEKAYATDLYAPFLTVFHPKTFRYIKSISTGQTEKFGYNSTEQMVQCGKYVYTNCWCYNDLILIIDTQRDEVVDSIHLKTSMQPKSMVLDARKRLWVVTDGGYDMGTGSFGQNIPHLYQIDTETNQILSDQQLDADFGNVQIAMNPTKDTLYLINNDIYRMGIDERHLPVRPFIEAPTDKNGNKHMLYGINVNPENGDIYVADAIDYTQSGAIYRYSTEGILIDQFKVGVIPNGMVFK